MLGICVANINRGRPVFYFICLTALAILFDFIQMIIQGETTVVGGKAYGGYQGAAIWSLLCAIVDFFIKGLQIFCANRLFVSLGGSWSFSASFGAGSDDQDSAYANLAANAEGGGNAAETPYEAGYSSPPTNASDL